MVSFSSLKSIAARKSQQEFTILGGEETNNDKKKQRKSKPNPSHNTQIPHPLLTKKVT